MNFLIKLIAILGVTFFVLNIALVGRFYYGKKEIASNNQQLSEQRIKLNPVEKLEIHPIVDLLTDEKNLKTEPGTSFLIETDHDTILFDVGYNIKKEQVSPLLHNLKFLDINLEDIDALAISHNHADHVGGFCYRDSRIELTNGPVELNGKNIFTPVPMSCDTANTKTIDQPRLISKDIASTGPLAEQMFIPGKLSEQALLVNVKGKGLVLISGCGHPGIIRMVETAQKITGIPIYAVVGGLHLYYTKAATGIWGNIFGSSKLYCRTPSREEVINTVDELKKLGVKKAYISPHDADQPTLQIFAERFGRDFEPLKVGKPITF